MAAGTPAAAIFDKLSLDLSSSAAIQAPVVQSVNVEPINLGSILEPQIGPAEAGGVLTQVPSYAVFPSYGGDFATAGFPASFRDSDVEQAFLDRLISPEIGGTRITRQEGVSRSAIIFLALAVGGAVLLLR